MVSKLEKDVRQISHKEEFREYCRVHFGSDAQQLVNQLNERINFLIRTDLKLALREVEEFRRISRFFDHPLDRALARRANARVLHMLGRRREALRFYDQAAEVYRKNGKLLDVAKINRAKVEALMYLGRYKQALDSAKVARRIFRGKNHQVDLAQLETNVGNLYHRLDHNLKALKHYDKAREVFLGQDDPVSVARIEFNRANIFSNLNDTETAIELYNKAAELYARAGMKLAEAQAKYSIAYVHYLCGNFTRALKMFLEVRKDFNQLGDRSGEALCDLDLSEIYLQLNAFADSLESASRAEKSFKNLHMRYERAKAITFRALSLFGLGNYRQAVEHLTRAQDLFARENNKTYVALIDLYLAEISLKREASGQSLKKVKKAYESFRSVGLRQKAGQAQLTLAKIELLRGREETARNLLETVLTKAREENFPGLSYRCSHLLGRLREKQGDWEAAYLNYEEAIADVERMRTGIAPDEFKMTFFEDKLSVYEDMINLCLRSPLQQKHEDAFHYLESAKSKTLLEMLWTGSKVEVANKAKAGSRLLKRLTRVRADLDYLYNRSTREEMRVARRASRFRLEAVRQIKRKENELVRLCREMRLSREEFLSPPEPDTLSLADVQRQLERDEVVIEYFLSDDSLAIFLIHRNRLQVFNQNGVREQLLKSLRGLRFQLDKFLYGQDYVKTHRVEIYECALNHLSQLRRLLIGPLEDSISGKRLIFVPYGFLHSVPFLALFSRRDGSREGKFLVDEHEVSVAPSSFVYAVCSKRKPRGHRKVTIFGVPTETVPAVGKESRAVKAIFPNGTIFLKERSSKENFLSKSPGSSILHVACHAVFREDNPLFSALRLSDGWLSFYDLLELDLGADLVTLSACHTGSAKVTGGDELLGLFRGFLLSGSSSLLVTLWAVGDVSTASFIKSFYRNLKRGMAKRAALRRAVLDTKRRYPHPYFWSPFMLVGKN